MAVSDRAIDGGERLVGALAALKDVSRARHRLRRGSHEYEAAKAEEDRLIKLVRDLVHRTS